jgi:hypothetical protein
VALYHFVRRVSEYQQAAAARAALEETVSRLEQDVAGALARVRDFLGSWQVSADDTLAGLSAAVNALEARRRRADFGKLVTEITIQCLEIFG